MIPIRVSEGDAGPIVSGSDRGVRYPAARMFLGNIMGRVEIGATLAAHPFAAWSSDPFPAMPGGRSGSVWGNSR